MFFIPGNLIALLTFPGVAIHELAHQLLCHYFKIPVYEVCYFRTETPSGYVVHGAVTNWRHQVLIAAGPFFLNSILGVVLAFPSVLRVFEFDGASSPIDFVLIWLGISIAMHAIPSTGDARSMWQAVSGRNASFFAKIIVAPIVGLIFILSVGTIFWLDAIYATAICIALPNYLVAALI